MRMRLVASDFDVPTSTGRIRMTGGSVVTHRIRMLLVMVMPVELRRIPRWPVPPGRHPTARKCFLLSIDRIGWGQFFLGTQPVGAE